MSILAELNALVAALGIPVETGVFSGEALPPNMSLLLR